MKKYVFIFLTFHFCIGCNQWKGSDVPSITIIEVFPEKVREFRDSIFFRIKYEDRDGDLGENSPDIENLFVQDKRTHSLIALRIPRLSPLSAGTAISGIFSFSIPYTLLTTTDSAEGVQYRIWVKDRKGNQSNISESKPVTVIR